MAWRTRRFCNSLGRPWEAVRTHDVSADFLRKNQSGQSEQSTIVLSLNLSRLEPWWEKSQSGRFLSLAQLCIKRRLQANSVIEPNDHTGRSSVPAFAILNASNLVK